MLCPIHGYAQFVEATSFWPYVYSYVVDMRSKIVHNPIQPVANQYTVCNMYENWRNKLETNLKSRSPIWKVWKCGKTLETDLNNHFSACIGLVSESLAWILAIIVLELLNISSKPTWIHMYRICTDTNLGCTGTDLKSRLDPISNENKDVLKIYRNYHIPFVKQVLFQKGMNTWSKLRTNSAQDRIFEACIQMASLSYFTVHKWHSWQSSRIG